MRRRNPARSHHGFTLLELILAFSILTIMTAVSYPLYQGMQTQRDVDATAELSVLALRRAHTLSQGSLHDTQWGVRFEQGMIIIFKGTSYSTRDSSYDDVITISSSILISGLNEFVFQKLTGEPLVSGALILTPPTNDAHTITITPQGAILF